MVRTHRHLNEHRKVSLKVCLRVLGEELYGEWRGEGSTVKRLIYLSTNILQRVMGSHAECLDGLFALASLNTREYVSERGKGQASDVERPNNALLLEFWKALYRINKKWDGPQKILSFAIGGHHKASEKVQAFLSGGAGLGVAPRTLNKNEARVASEFSFRVAHHYAAGPCTLALRAMDNFSLTAYALSKDSGTVPVGTDMAMRCTPPRPSTRDPVDMELLLRMSGAYSLSPGRDTSPEKLALLLEALMLTSRRGDRARVHLYDRHPEHIKTWNVEARNRGERVDAPSITQALAYFEKDPATAPNILYCFLALRDLALAVNPNLVQYIEFWSLDHGTLNLLNRIRSIIRLHPDIRVRQLLSNVWTLPEVWHVIYSVLKQLILAGNEDDDSFLWDEIWEPFFRFASRSTVFSPIVGTDPVEPTLFQQALPARRPNTQKDTLGRQLQHAKELAHKTADEAQALSKRFPNVQEARESAERAIRAYTSAQGILAATVPGVTAAFRYVDVAQQALADTVGAVGFPMRPGVGANVGIVPGPGAGDGVGAEPVSGAVPEALGAATRKKQKLSRNFNELLLVLMLFSRAWDSGVTRWRPRLDAAVALRPTSAAYLLLNLFMHIIPSVSDWFKVLKYSSDPVVVMRMLSDMTAVCSMVGCTHYVVALAQFIAQLQELQRKAPNLWDVVMRNFHAFNGLFIEDQHAHLTRLLEGAHRFITGKIVNDELRLLEYHASSKELLKQFDTVRQRTTWSLPTADNPRYDSVVKNCVSILENAIMRACSDSEASRLEDLTTRRLTFDQIAVERLVEKVRVRDTDQYIAEREENVSDFAGDKMVRQLKYFLKLELHTRVVVSWSSLALTCLCMDCPRPCGGP
jgi:hypothetical protein